MLSVRSSVSPSPLCRSSKTKQSENIVRYWRDCGSGRVDHWWHLSCLYFYSLSAINFNLSIVQLYFHFWLVASGNGRTRTYRQHVWNYWSLPAAAVTVGRPRGSIYHFFLVFPSKIKCHFLVFADICGLAMSFFVFVNWQ